jgi:hypothetical protein
VPASAHTTAVELCDQGRYMSFATFTKRLGQRDCRRHVSTVGRSLPKCVTVAAVAGDTQDARCRRNLLCREEDKNGHRLLARAALRRKDAGEEFRLLVHCHYYAGGGHRREYCCSYRRQRCAVETDARSHNRMNSSPCTPGFQRPSLTVRRLFSSTWTSVTEQKFLTV